MPIPAQSRPSDRGDRVVFALPDIPERSLLPKLPSTVEVILLPDDGNATWPDLSSAEIVVPGFGSRERFLRELRDRAQPARLPRLRVVHTLTAGVDWLRGAVPDGVTVCSARGAYDGPLAEWIVGAILAFQRGILRSRDSQLRGAWQPFELESLADRTVVILGFGSIGTALADRLRPFGVRVVGVARTARADAVSVDDLEYILPEADVLVDLLPLTAETEGFLDARRLARLRDGALVVNAGRGRTLHTGALVAEVSTGRLSAALDVTEPEPLPDGHPLWALPNVLVSPHIAGDSRRAFEGVWVLLAEQVRRYIEGAPLENEVPRYQLR